MKIFLYICIWIAGGNCPVKEDSRTPFPDTFVRDHLKSEIMKTINLSQGQVALVDDEDYNFLMQWKWHAYKGRRGGFYAARNNRENNGDSRILKMHRVIMKTPKGMECDHIFHNTLDNRKFIEINGEIKCNLRNCTKKENGKNMSAWGASKYLGVSFDKRKKVKQVRAQICVERKSIGLGYYLTEEEAARAYDRGAKKYFGVFANLNFKP